MSQKFVDELTALLNCYQEQHPDMADTSFPYLRTLLKAVQQRDVPGLAGVFRHNKHGSEYRIVLNNTHLQTDLPLEDMSKLVIYIDADGKSWARTVEEFGDPTRFKKID